MKRTHIKHYDNDCQQNRHYLAENSVSKRTSNCFTCQLHYADTEAGKHRPKLTEGGERVAINVIILYTRHQYPNYWVTEATLQANFFFVQTEN